MKGHAVPHIFAAGFFAYGIIDHSLSGNWTFAAIFAGVVVFQVASAAELWWRKPNVTIVRTDLEDGPVAFPSEFAERTAAIYDRKGKAI